YWSRRRRGSTAPPGIGRGRTAWREAGREGVSCCRSRCSSCDRTPRGPADRRAIPARTGCRNDVSRAEAGLHMSEVLDVTLLINERSYLLRLEPRRTLLDAIRDECGLTGTHMGCEHGVCGACTVLVDGDPVRACLMFAVQAQESAIRTVEGLARGEELHPL